MPGKSIRCMAGCGWLADAELAKDGKCGKCGAPTAGVFPGP